MIRRRDLGLSAGAALALGSLHGPLAMAQTATPAAPAGTLPAQAGIAPAAGGASPAMTQRLAAIEAASDGRLGVAIADMGSGSLLGYRAAERFPLCSVYKLLAAAAVLALVDAGKADLDHRIFYGRHEVVAGSPVTLKHIGAKGLSLAHICDAAVTRSDNTAGNLLLSFLGGPAPLTAYIRSIGDNATELDRGEPDVNQATPGDPKDTTVPAAMLSDLLALLMGNKLSAPSRAQLMSWMRGCKTGAGRLEAGLPSGWHIGDKTGSGGYGTTNDIGIVWPAAGPPILVAAFLTDTTAPAARRNAALAAVGAIIGELRT
jgi:beta-lactamase class A